MRFVKATLLTTNLLILSTSLYWTLTSWINRHPSHKPRECLLERKMITRSGSFYRTEFFVKLFLKPDEPPAKPPVIAFRYSTSVFNQTLTGATSYLQEFQLQQNYTCFIKPPRKSGERLKEWHYDISMTFPAPSSQPWIATLFTFIALLSLLLQLVFVKFPIQTIVIPQTVTPPPKVGLSKERVEELCTECSVEECAICLEEDPKTGARLPCGHSFHKVCLERWLVRGSVCPLCNCDLTAGIEITSWNGVRKSGNVEDSEQIQENLNENVVENVTNVTPILASDSSEGLRRRKSRQTDVVELD